ncbi:hypothetical protein [Sphingomonas sanguinis]|uniref:Uncharacterized protein n=1 Tax=Sphingomonas sanguinis TaxID=33051 RepID=A0A147HTQ7_9SPHN|nr:hypothetical protein [Sphingomonas sanguinis]KTT68246.1 hypothetical protein NS319_14765 [Sphingomonas sanguinis]
MGAHKTPDAVREALQAKHDRIHPTNRRPDLPIMLKMTFGNLCAILAALDRRAGDDLTPRERIARVAAWEHFGIAWHHMEKQSHADVLAMVDRMLDSRAGDAGEGIPTADELEASGKAPWHAEQPIEDLAKQWKGRPWVPLEAAISALQFWQRRDYEHTMSALNSHVPAGWIGWSGGVVPVQGTDARGLILFKGESVKQAEERGEEVLDYWPWHDADGQPLATAYKPATPAPAVDAVPAWEVERLREALTEAVAVLERLPYGDWPGKMYSGKTVAANALIRRARAALSHGEGRNG